MPAQDNDEGRYILDPETKAEIEATIEQEQEQEQGQDSEAQKQTDDLNQLFQGPKPDDSDIETADLIRVDNEDVFGSEDGDLSDLVDVTNEDIMGDDDEGWGEVPRPQSPLKHRPIKRTHKPYRYAPPRIAIQGIRNR